MARFEVKKHNVLDRAHGETVAHEHVPGRAYNVANPADRLIHVIGGGFFNEPKYYDKNRSNLQFHAELIHHGRVTSATTDEMGLTAQAKEVFETCAEVAKGEYENSDPHDLLVIAAWARDTEHGLKMRTTPQIAYAVAAANERTRPHVRLYGTSIMKRPDDVTQVFGAFRHLFNPKVEGRHRGMLPHSLRRGMESALAGFSDYQILKWNNEENRPNLSDVLKMLNGHSGFPLSKAMHEYVVNGNTVEGAPDVLMARQEFFALENVEGATPELVKRAQLTWENMSSKFGDKEAGTPARVWELIIPYMPEMAMVRNLRNFENAGISDESWDIVEAKLDAVENTVQLPFRFFTAHREVQSVRARTVVSKMLDKACAGLPDLNGTTVLFADNSGSATGCPISAKSNMRVSDAGNTLMAVAAKRYGRGAQIGVFGDRLRWVPFAENETCLTIKERIDRYALTDYSDSENSIGIDRNVARGLMSSGTGVGGGTETGLWFGIDDLTKREVHVDRIIMLSDLCCYTMQDDNCGVDLTKLFGQNATVQGMVDRYRSKVNADCKVYSINLSGHAQAQTRDEPGSHKLSGWSDKIYQTIRDLEVSPVPNLNQPQAEVAVEVPTIQVLRDRYKIGD